MTDFPRPWADYEPLFSKLWPSLAHLDGDVAEFGVYNGGNCFALARVTSRKVWAFDTFEGIPQEDYIAGLDIDAPGKFAPQYDLLHVDPSYGIVPVKGRFADTLPGCEAQIVMALVDCDLYVSVTQALEWLSGHLTRGGIVILDDYKTHAGVQRAVKEFLGNHPKAEFDPPHLLRNIA